jgi:site-specific DNA-methyltransferase (adenine-specific)
VIDIRLGRWQDVLADVPDGSVRLLLTSPPYDNARTYEGTQTEIVDFGELARFALRVLCPGGVLAMVLDGAVNDGVQSVTPYRVICEWSAMEGWRFRQFLVYGRDGQCGAWGNGWFRRDHEPLLYFIRDGAPPVCNKVDLREHGGRWKANRMKRNRDGSVTHYNKPKNEGDTVDRGSVWYYGNVGCDSSAGAGHPATFAERFALDAVKVWSNPGDLVCDPFSGSGTVAVACRGLGRRFVGAERVPLYHEMSLRRLDPTHVSPERAAEPVGPLFDRKHDGAGAATPGAGTRSSLRPTS